MPLLLDAQFLAEIENDPQVKRFVGGPSGKSEADYRGSISALADCRCLTIESLSTQEPIGRCGLILIDNEPDIHVILARHYWGRGLGSEVALGLKQFSSEMFPEKALVAKAHPENAASLSILRKLEFVQTGVVDSPFYDNGFLRFRSN
jgi:RimJ/RimL family protein N-acetyltransferase